MGTPEFADVSLRELIKEKYDICAVFAQTDKPVGRKQVLTPPKTKTTAEENGIEVYQPKSLKTGDSEQIIKNLAPDLIVVVAYGKILPKNIIDIPKMGCINVHGSLLPKYRGAAPVQWSVINGESSTGITTMFMDEHLDTGDILLKETTKIGEDETSGELFERMGEIGAKLLIKTIKGLEKGEIKPIKQEGESSYAPMLNKEMAKIDFNKNAQQIHNLIRGLNPWPVAYTQINGKLLKVYKSKLIDLKAKGQPGEIISLNPFIVCCSEGEAIELTQVQLEGKRRMTSSEFINGFKVKEGTILGGEN